MLSRPTVVAERDAWSLPADVTFLNHGSFGPTPRVVQEARESWSRRLASQPMAFYLTELEPALDAAAEALGHFLDASPHDLVLTDNATTAMNIVAHSVSLEPGDEVLLNNHEYGAVRRIWQAACDRQQARLTTATIPVPVATTEDVVEPLFAAVSPRTRLIVISHVTSPTAIIFPVAEVCARAKQLGIPVCIDGPHAMAMCDVSLRKLGADFYCASLHKWLSAPLGSGLLYVAKPRQREIRSPLVSWGRSLSGRPARWQDELNWLGTRDPASLLAVPAAIEFLRQRGLQQVRDHGHALVRYARQRIEELVGSPSLVPDDPAWYGMMITVPLPEGPSLRAIPNQWDPWQKHLREQHGIEIPFVDWNGRRHIRISSHLYNNADDIDHLLSALTPLVKGEIKSGAS